MGWKKQASNSGGGGDRELAPAGNHAAVLVALVDIGTHEDDYKGVKSMNRKVFLCWELTAEETRPLVHRDFTFSLNTKALLRQFIARWRGKDLAEGEEFDVSVLVGKKCMVTVEHTTSGDRTFAKVTGVGSQPKGFAIPDASRETVLWSIDDNDTDELPDWLPWNWGAPLTKWAEDSQERKDKKAQPATVPAEADDDGNCPF